VLGQDDNMAEWAQEKLAVVKSMLVAVKDYVVSQKSTGIDPQVDKEFDMIESVIESLAVRNQVDAEVIWEDLESLTEDELYVFAVTQEPVNEDWQKVNKKDKTDGMSKKAVNAYRRENPGSKLKTAVTTKPSKLKKGSKASKRRKSYCSRSKGQMNMHNISCAKTPDKAICKARRRWNC
jgi:DNA-binding transcriptional regulator YdaS (Cro superfamily)